MESRIQCLRVRASIRSYTQIQDQNCNNLFMLIVKALEGRSFASINFLKMFPITRDDTSTYRYVSRIRRNILQHDSRLLRCSIEEKYGIIVPTRHRKGTHISLDNRVIPWSQSKWLLLWACNKIPGRHSKCLKCERLYCSKDHFEECFNVRDLVIDHVKFESSLDASLILHLVPLRKWIVEFFLFHDFVLSCEGFSKTWKFLSDLVRTIAVEGVGWTIVQLAV